MAVRSSWVLESEAGGKPQVFDPFGRFDFTDGPLRGFMEHLHVAGDITLYRLEGQAASDYSLTAGRESPPGMLVLGCMLNGSGRLLAEGNDEHSWRDGGQFYALTPYRRQISYHVSAASPWRSLAIKIGPRTLQRLAEQDSLPAPARDALNRGAEPFATMRPLGAALLRTAQDLLRPTYTGNLARLYREAKVLELLALQLDALGDGRPSDDGISPRDRLRIREAHDRLLADLRNPPGLQDLADAVGLSPKRLNRGFAELYGATVFEYLRNARLDAARRMLEEGLDLPLKQIAWRVGYAHATNFISAYRNRFGLPPGLHKRLRGEED